MSDAIASVQNVTRRFGKTRALDDITLSVVRGSVFGLVGENGAGKTTLIKHLLGLYRAQQGTVRVFGIDPVREPVGVLGRIGYLSEERDLPEWMRLSELMRYTQAFYPHWDDRLARESLELFELNPDQKVRTLSRGQRARAGLLVALAHRLEFVSSCAPFPLRPSRPRRWPCGITGIGSRPSGRSRRRFRLFCERRLAARERREHKDRFASLCSLRFLAAIVRVLWLCRVV